MVSGLECGGSFGCFWAEKVRKCLWWRRECAGWMAVNWVLGEEAGCLVDAVEEFGGLGVAVCMGRMG